MGTLIIVLSSFLGLSISICGISWGFGVGEESVRLVVLILTVEGAEVTGLDDGAIDRDSVCVCVIKCMHCVHNKNQLIN